VPRQIKHPVDLHVGLRIRVARAVARLSQEQLGKALGLTFQQVQKYEKGVNRVGAGRLSDIARILGVPISYFFENAGGGGNASTINDGLAAIIDTLSTPEGVRIGRALAQIGETNVGKCVADLLEAMVDRESRKAVA
jgi:transcriptional regulator with XRE-family HTH domain